MPGVFNPQNLNRYGYVRNNPVRYADPSGHAACSDAYDFCGKMNFDGKVTTSILRRALRQYDIKIGKSNNGWDITELETIYFAANRVGVAFSEARGKGESATDAFKEVYDEIEFIQVYSFDGNKTTGCKTEVNIITCADFSYPRFQSSVINIVHELGHAFDPKVDGVWDSGSYGLPQAFVDHRNTILRDNNTIQWQANPSPTKLETFGDFFVAWVYGEWGSDADRPYGVDGTARNWMTTNMSEWLNP